MSDLYKSLREKWADFLSAKHYYCFGEMEDEIATLNRYDEWVEEFGDEYDYTEKTVKRAFYETWYDTFIDMYFQELEERDIKILHENPIPGDWDYGKKFKMGMYGWEEG